MSWPRATSLYFVHATSAIIFMIRFSRKLYCQDYYYKIVMRGNKQNSLQQHYCISNYFQIYVILNQILTNQSYANFIICNVYKNSLRIIWFTILAFCFQLNIKFQYFAVKLTLLMLTIFFMFTILNCKYVNLGYISHV